MGETGPSYLVLNGPCRGQRLRATSGDTLVVPVRHPGHAFPGTFIYKLIKYSTGTRTHYFWVNPTTPVGDSQVFELLLEFLIELGDTIRPTNRRTDD